MVHPHRSLLRNTAGNVSTFFAIAIVPLLLSAGTAIDYISANRAETRLRGAIDSAAMAVAASGDISDAKRKDIGKTYFRRALQGTTLAEIDPEVDIKNEVVTVKVHYQYPTSFMMLAGINHMPIEIEAQVAGGTDSNTELVMVLDYSLSMNDDDKYIRMREAATSMVNKLVDGKGKTTVKIGIVPFSAMVRTSMPAKYVTQSAASATWTGCTQDRKYPYNTGISTPTTDDTTKWGYIESSKQNSGSMSCANYATNNVEIVPLTEDSELIKTQLSEMEPIGYTNIALGTEFGWNLLDPDEPFDEAVDYSDKVTKKFIIILTDGVQTTSEWGSGGSRSVSNAQDNLVSLCGGMEDKGITTFTIAYDVTDPAVTKLLKKCAGANYFNASTSGDDIASVFGSITKRIRKSTLRLAR